MSPSTLYLVLFVASTFSAVVCTPQTPGQTPDQIQNDPGASANSQDGAPFDTSINLALLRGADKGITTALQGNKLSTTPSTDSTVVGAELTGGGAGGVTSKSQICNARFKKAIYG